MVSGTLNGIWPAREAWSEKETGADIVHTQTIGPTYLFTTNFKQLIAQKSIILATICNDLRLLLTDDLGFASKSNPKQPFHCNQTKTLNTILDT